MSLVIEERTGEGVRSRQEGEIEKIVMERQWWGTGESEKWWENGAGEGICDSENYRTFEEL